MLGDKACDRCFRKVGYVGLERSRSGSHYFCSRCQHDLTIMRIAVKEEGEEHYPYTFKDPLRVSG